MTEPEVDEVRFEQAQRASKVSALRSSPLDEDRCSTCYYYLELDQGPAYCWHEKLQILVGPDWWCHYWEMRQD